MSLFKVLSKSFQFPDECNHPRSPAQTNFLKIMKDKSSVYFLKLRKRNRSLRNAVFQTAKSASLDVTGSEGAILVSEKLHDHFNLVLIRNKSQHLVDKATGLNNVSLYNKLKKFFQFITKKFITK